MAKLTFYERYRSDKNFKTRADGLLMESIFAMAGIDPESLCKRWESGDRALLLADVTAKLPMPKSAGVAKAAPPPEEEGQEEKPKRATSRRSTTKRSPKKE